MTGSNGQSGQSAARLQVGQRVTVTPAAGGGVGWVVEDFGPLPDEGVVHLDAATTIRPRRYAIALDDGTLLFLNRADFDAAGNE